MNPRDIPVPSSENSSLVVDSDNMLLQCRMHVSKKPDQERMKVIISSHIVICSLLRLRHKYDYRSRCRSTAHSALALLLAGSCTRSASEELKCSFQCASQQLELVKCSGGRHVVPESVHFKALYLDARATPL